MKISIKEAFNKKRILAVIAIFTIIVVMIVSNPEVGEFFSSTETVRLKFQTGVEYDMMAYDNEILLVNNEGVFAIDKKGRESWSAVAATASPQIWANGRYFMLADINGKVARTFEKEKLIAQIETENEILSAKMNKNGYVALATDELGYKGMVMLFNKNGREKFRWHSGTGYIGDIDVSDNNKLAVAQLTTDKDKVYSRIIVIDPGSDKEPECIAELEGIVMKLKYRDNGTLVAVSDKGVYAYKRSGKQRFVIDFEGRKPIECNIENENNMVFAFDSGLNSIVLESYSSSGKKRGSYDAESEIFAIDVNGECIVVAKRDGIVRVTPKGKVKKEIKASKDVKDIRVFAGRNKMLSLGGDSAEIIKIR